MRLDSLLCAIGLVCLSTFPAISQNVDLALVDDINTKLVPVGSFSRNFAQLGDRILFSAVDGIHDRSLWSTDGTVGGTQIIGPGVKIPSLHRENQYVVLGGRAFFFAEDSHHGLELWTSNGTPEGTEIVLDIRPGPEPGGYDGYFGKDVPYLVAVADRVFFPAVDDEHGVELWSTDGTGEGTQIVFDICPGVCGSFPQFLTAVGDLVFFGVGGDEPQGRIGRPTTLWRSDGTPGGTFEVLDSAEPRCFAEHDGRLLVGTFRGVTVSDSVEELWVSDGTQSGTIAIHQFIDPDAYRYPCDFRTATGGVVFTASTDETGLEIWRTDGTAAGTYLLKDINPGSNWSSIEMGPVFDGNAMFAAYTTDDGRHLWKSDGTPSGTAPVVDPCPGTGGDVTGFRGVFVDRLFFEARDCEHGIEPWVSDGTPEGSMMLVDASQTGIGSGLGSVAAEMEGLLYFSTGGNTLWRSDGTPEATTPVLIGASGDYFTIFDTIDDGLVFTGYREDIYGTEPWRTDGTEAGTNLLKDIFPATASSWPQRLCAVGDSVYFVAWDEANGPHLRTTDGDQGSSFVAAGWETESPTSLTAYGHELWFWAKKEYSGPTLWKTDGTQEGTVPMDHLCDGGGREVAPGLYSWRGQIIFSAGASDLDLSISDGTPEGTRVLKEGLWFGLEGNLSKTPSVADMGDFLLFVGKSENTDRDRELWRTDGTPDGTFLVKDINPYAESDPRELTRIGPLVFFSAMEGTKGRELWVTDGTTEGTRMVKDILPGIDSSRPGELTAHLGRLYFSATDQLPGGHIWVSDGTEEGTSPVVSVGQHPYRFTSYADGLYFVDGTTWKQWLWRTDGTPNGTVKVIEIPETPTARAPKLFVLGNSLFLVNLDRDYRVTVWRIRSYDDARVFYTDGASWGDLSSWTYAHGPYVLFSATTSIIGEELWRFRAETPAPRRGAGRLVPP